MSKFISITLIIVVGFLVWQSVAPVHAATGLVPCGRQADDTSTKDVDESSPCQVCDTLVLADRIKNFVFFNLVPAIAVLLYLWAGFSILLSGSKITSIQTGQNIFKTTTIGLFVIFGSWLITNTVLRSLAGSYLDKSGPWYRLTCNDPRQPSGGVPALEIRYAYGATGCVPNPRGEYTEPTCGGRAPATAESEDIARGRELAAELLARGISFSKSADCGGDFQAFQNIQDIRAGKYPAVCSPACDCKAGGASGTVTLNWRILEGLKGLYDRMKSTYGVTITVTSLTTGKHSAGSSHYTGEGVDIVVNSTKPSDWDAARAYLRGFAGSAICERKSDAQDEPTCDLSKINHIHWTLRR